MATYSTPKTVADFAAAEAGYTGQFGDPVEQWKQQNWLKPNGQGNSEFQGKFNNAYRKWQKEAVGSSQLSAQGYDVGSGPIRYDINPEVPMQLAEANGYTGPGSTMTQQQAATAWAANPNNAGKVGPAQDIKIGPNTYSLAQMLGNNDRNAASTAAIQAQGIDPNTMQPKFAGSATSVNGVPTYGAQPTTGSGSAGSSLPMPASSGSGAQPGIYSGPINEKWTQPIATELGRLFGVLGESEIAQGGLLENRLVAASPEIRNEFNRIREMVVGGSPPETILNALVDRETKTQTSNPEYGSLAKPPYEKFKPFALSDFMADPGYQFRQEQGNKAINAAQSARGNFYSGAALKEATKFNSGLASQEYGDAYNRYNTNFGLGYGQAKGDADTLYSRLGGLANSGQNATNTAVNANQNNSSVLGSIYGAEGRNQANATLSQGSNYSNLLSSILGGGQSQYNNGAFNAGAAARKYF